MATAAWVAAPPCAAAAVLADGLDVAPWVVALPALVAIALAARTSWCLRATSGHRASVPVWCAVGAACALGRWSEAAVAAVLSALAIGAALHLARRGRGRLDAAALLPRRARTWRGARWQRCASDALRCGDIARVLPGERIASDGCVRGVGGDVDQRALTGERGRVRKAGGDALYAGSRNGSRTLDYEVGGAPAGSLLARSASVRLHALARSAEAQRRLQRQALLGALASAVAMALALAIAGRAAPTWGAVLLRVPVLLAVAWPFALVLCVPACTAAALAAAARRGIVFDGAESLRRIAHAAEIVLDGAQADVRFEFDRWQLLGVRQAPSRLLGIVRGLAAQAPQPALATLATAFDTLPCHATHVRCEGGRGVAGRVDGIEYRLGEPLWVLGDGTLPSTLRSLVQLQRARGCSVALLGDAGGALALFALTRSASPRIAAAFDALAMLGVRGAWHGADDAPREAPRIVLDAAARGVPPDAAGVVVLAPDPARAVDALTLARSACASWKLGCGVALAGKGVVLALALGGVLTLPLALLGEFALGAIVLGLARRVRRAA
jgi:cation transport ATPase